MRSKVFLRSVRFLSVVLLVLTTTASWSVEYKVLHNFGPTHVWDPSSGLIADGAGNLYGVAARGEYLGGYGGAAYQLSSTGGFSVIHAFGAIPDGVSPQGILAFDPAGNLYGTTLGGGTSKQCQFGCGTVFELTPPTDGGAWTETILYSFCSAANCTDGANPEAGLILDSTGNVYGTTEQGGVGGAVNGCGTVFELTPNAGGVWTETVLLDPAEQDVGCHPQGGLTFGSGNLYGVLGASSTQDAGEIYELSLQDGSWVYTPIWNFNPFRGFQYGAAPTGGLVFDAVGNLYGTTRDGGNLSCGQEGCGVVFELSPGQGGQWTETVLHNFGSGTDGVDPNGNLVIDAAGNLYGTTFVGGSLGQMCNVGGCGTVFELTPSGNGQWTESVFRFPGDASRGGNPNAPLLLDGAGHAYGTTSVGGRARGQGGVIFQFTQ